MSGKSTNNPQPFASANLLLQVVGVDFGTLNTVIAVARNRGVDVVCLPSSQSIAINTDLPDHK